jgi:hypothetical protein
MARRYEEDEEDDRPRRRRRLKQEDDEEDEIAESSPPGNGMAVTSMILGLVGFCVPVICGCLAILFGFLGLGRSKQTGSGKGMAIAGLILGVVNGIVIPAIAGFIIYRGVVAARREVARVQAAEEAYWKRVQEEDAARQKKWDDDRKADAKRWEEDEKKRQAEDKARQEKWEADRKQREAEALALAKKRDEERKQQEEDRKAAALKREEERKKIDAENKFLGEVNTAKQQIFAIETACKLYMSRNQNRPPQALKDLLNPPAGLKLNVKQETLTDPWGKEYQYNSANKDTNGRPDPIVWTVHPMSGDPIKAFNRK